MTVASSSSPIRINLGSGHQEHPGWIGYDRSRVALLARMPPIRLLMRTAMALGAKRFGGAPSWPTSTRVHDVTRGIPCETSTVDAIYSSHMLEHLHPGEAEALLAECHRVLKPGGGMRVVVPDLHQLAEKYVAGDRDFFPAGSPLIADALMAGFYHQPTKKGLISRVVYRLLRADDGGHRWMYDEESLSAKLAAAGFEKVERLPAGKGRLDGAASLDSRSTFHLHLEAFKPLN